MHISARTLGHVTAWQWQTGRNALRVKKHGASNNFCRVTRAIFRHYQGCSVRLSWGLFDLFIFSSCIGLSFCLLTLFFVFNTLFRFITAPKYEYTTY